MESKNKSDTSTKSGTWNHIKITQTIPEQHIEKEGYEGTIENSHIGHFTNTLESPNVKGRTFNMWNNITCTVQCAGRLLRSCVRIPPGAWMFVLCVVCCQVEVSATSWSLVQNTPPTVARGCVWSRNLVDEEVHSPRWAAEPEIIIKWTVNCNYRIAATLHTVETRLVSGA
jgi:hypothetical protein